MKVKTGFGYLKDKDGHIVGKYDFPPGEHQLPKELTFVEVSTRKQLEKIEVYTPPLPPPTEIEVREEKIQVEMVALTRAAAVKSLEDKGEIERGGK